MLPGMRTFIFRFQRDHCLRKRPASVGQWRHPRPVGLEDGDAHAVGDSVKAVASAPIGLAAQSFRNTPSPVRIASGSTPFNQRAVAIQARFTSR